MGYTFAMTTTPALEGVKALKNMGWAAKEVFLPPLPHFTLTPIIPSTPDLTVFVEPDLGQPAFARHGDWVIRYQGSSISPMGQKALKKLTKALPSLFPSPLNWLELVPPSESIGFLKVRQVGPAMFYVDIPSACIQTCLFCDRSAGLRVAEEAALRPAKDQLLWLRFVLSQLSPPPASEFQFGGSEPLTFNGLADLFRVIQEKGFAPSRMDTTGWPVTSALIQQLVEAGLKEVTIPVYAAEPALHDRIVRHKGAYHKTLQALEFFAAAGVEICIHSLVLRENIHDIPNLFHLLAHLKSNQVRVVWPKEIPRAPWLAWENYPALTDLKAALADCLWPDGKALALCLPPCGVPEHLHPHLRPLLHHSSHATFCKTCTYRHNCPGPGKEYENIFY